MTKRKRLPQAPNEPLPELAEFLAPFRIKFTFKRSFTSLERYLTGLLTEHPQKNCDTLAQVVPGTTQQNLQYLLTDLVWDEQALNRQRIQRMLELPTEGDGVLVIDDTGFVKKGTASVGVARQYTGTAGKVCNCQVTVNCHYAERTLAWPVATRLYLPREWTDAPARCAKAHVPPTVAFQTKAEIALALLDEAAAAGVVYACVVADGDYGDNPNFLNGLEERGQRCVAAVRKDFQVSLGWGAQTAAQRAETLIAGQHARDWQTICWRHGHGAPLKAQFTAVRCWRVDGDGTRQVGWLIGERPGREPTGEQHYYWSNFPRQTPLVKLVEYEHRRCWIEQYHEEAKGELGWDQHQGRVWESFHRHALTVMLAYSFLVWLEYRQRTQQRRPGLSRPAFSPLPRHTSGVVAKRPSHGR
jgi:SRSO17 transposase